MVEVDIKEDLPRKSEEQPMSFNEKQGDELS